MNKSDASRFRRAAAKINYLSQDRLDITFASKEISRHMSSPKVGDEALVKRVVRYLKQHPRLAVSYPWQDECTEVTVYTDSDWGGYAPAFWHTGSSALKTVWGRGFQPCHAQILLQHELAANY